MGAGDRDGGGQEREMGQGGANWEREREMGQGGANWEREREHKQS